MKTFTSSRVLTYALIIALPLWFGSCKKNDDVVTPSSIEGSYRISAYRVDPGVDLLGTGTKSNDLLAAFKTLPNGIGNDLVECLTTTVVTFNSSGSVTSKEGAKCTPSNDMNPVTDQSTWKLDGTKLTITAGADVSVYDAVKSGNTLKLSQQQMEDFGEGTKNYMLTIEMTKV